MHYYMTGLCVVLISILITLIIKTKTYRDYYFCSHIAGGYVLLFFAAFVQKYSEEYYIDAIYSMRKPFFAIIFFGLSYIAFSLVYAIYYPDFYLGDNRTKKRVALIMLSNALILVFKKHSYFLLLVVSSVLIGIGLGLCNIYLVKKRRVIIRFVRNFCLCFQVERRIEYRPLPPDHGIEELDQNAIDDTADAA